MGLTSRPLGTDKLTHPGQGLGGRREHTWGMGWEHDRWGGVVGRGEPREPGLALKETLLGHPGQEPGSQLGCWATLWLILGFAT